MQLTSPALLLLMEFRLFPPIFAEENAQCSRQPRIFVRIAAVLAQAQSVILGSLLVKFLAQAQPTQVPNQLLPPIAELANAVAPNCDGPLLGELCDRLVHFCSDVGRFRVFVPFWLIALPGLPHALAEVVLTRFREVFDESSFRTVGDFHYLLYVFLVTRASEKNAFVATVWERLSAVRDENVPELPQDCREFLETSGDSRECLQKVFKAGYNRKIAAMAVRSSVQISSQDKFLWSLLTFASENAALFMRTMRKVAKNFNLQARAAESVYADSLSQRTRMKSQMMTQEELGRWTKTYRSLSFYSLGACPIALLPSPFPTQGGGVECPSPNSHGLFGMTRNVKYCAEKATDPLLTPLFEMSGRFTLDDVNDCLKSVIGGEFRYGNCTLLRRTISVSCVYGISSEELLLLSFAKYTKVSSFRRFF
jgi:hypothetical protein